MNNLYDLIREAHNGIGGLTLLLTLVAAVTLLVTARSTSGWPALSLRLALISASVQGLLGVLLVILGIVLGNAGYIGSLWLHFLLAVAAIGAVSALTARARRAGDGAARRFGGILLAVVVLVFVTFLVGQLRYNPLA